MNNDSTDKKTDNTLTENINQQPVTPSLAPSLTHPKSHNRQLLVLVAVAVLIMFSAIGFVVLKSSADKAAATYTKSLKGYLGKVYDVVSTEANTPTVAKDSIEQLEEPQLEPIAMGSSLSEDYAVAEELKDTTDEKLDDLSSQVDSSIAVYNFMIASDKASEYLAAFTGDKNSTDYTLRYLKSINDIKTAVDDNKSNAPDELKSSFNNLSQICADMITHYTAWSEAVVAKDETAAASAKASYTTAADLYAVEAKAIIAYYAAMSENLIESANNVVSVMSDVTSNDTVEVVDAPSNPDVATPNTVSSSEIITTVSSVSVADDRVCYVKPNGASYCWGGNWSGEIGNNSNKDVHTPTSPDMTGVLSGKTIKSIVAGSLHTCALASDSQVYCWGYGDSSGRLGNASIEGSKVPVAVSTRGVLKDKTVKSITAGEDHTCVIASDDKAYCWGANYYGQLGINSKTGSFVPAAVDTTGVLKDKTVKYITSGGSSTCVIASDNKAYCWGHNGYGQLGNYSNVDSLVPVAVEMTDALEGKTIKSIAIDESSACAIGSDDQAYCWGYNKSGQLGNGSTSSSTVPVAVNNKGVLSGKTIKSISLGYQSACAVASDNKAYCWGSNNFGGLGNNSTANSSVPVAVDTSGVLNGISLKSIETSTIVSCAVSVDDSVYCWGHNRLGQLGNGTATDSLVPVSVKF